MSISKRPGISPPLHSAFAERATKAPPHPPSNKRKRPAPLSLRLSPEERAELERRAAGGSLSAYIKQCVFEGEVPRKRRSTGIPIADQIALAKVLRALGRAALLEQLSSAQSPESSPHSPETDEAIRQACADIAAMRRDIIKALGLSPKDSP